MKLISKIPHRSGSNGPEPPYCPHVVRPGLSTCCSAGWICSWMKSQGWKSFRDTNAIDRIRHRLPLGSRSYLFQDDLGGSPIASPQLQKSLHRRGGVVLVVVVGVGEDGPSLLEKAIHEIRPPQ
jgi:hypothetical protein